MGSSDRPIPLLPTAYCLLPNQIKRGEENVREDPPLAWGHQETALLLHRRGRFRLAAGRALHRADRHAQPAAGQDRKSTRLNSSHTVISYAVFCLKKKKKTNTPTTRNNNK